MYVKKKMYIQSRTSSNSNFSATALSDIPSFQSFVNYLKVCVWACNRIRDLASYANLNVEQ